MGGRNSHSSADSESTALTEPAAAELGAASGSDAAAHGIREEADGQRRGLWRTIRSGYSDLVGAIIRPPRAEYTVEDLGPATFRLAGRSFERIDLQVVNPRGMRLECSWWRPAERANLPDQLPCVVYMHGNSSCRLEALSQLQLVLQMGLTLLSFDFAGCGLSEGENITLGYYEKDDLSAVIDSLRESGQVSTIALWGRSMGAATALLHGHRDPSIAAMVLDSPFSSLEQLAREIVDRVPLRRKPSVLVNAVLRFLRRSVLKKAGLDILRLRPIEHVHSCFIPAVFVAGLGDQFIHPHHTSDIHDRYAGDKNLIMVDGDHNSRRPPYFQDSVSIFFYNRLCAPVGLTEERLGLQPAAPPDQGFAMLNHLVQGQGMLGVGHVGRNMEAGSGFSNGAFVDDEDDAELQQALLASLLAQETDESEFLSVAEGDEEAHAAPAACDYVPHPEEAAAAYVHALGPEEAAAAYAYAPDPAEATAFHADTLGFGAEHDGWAAHAPVQEYSAALQPTAAVNQLVGCATTNVQSTMPERNVAAEVFAAHQ